MTMHIDEDVLAQVMELTGATSKTQAVEIALTQMAQRHRQKKFFQTGLGMTRDELIAATANDVFDYPFDQPDIDETKVARFFAAADVRRQKLEAQKEKSLKVAEDQAPYGSPDAR